MKKLIIILLLTSVVFASWMTPVNVSVSTGSSNNPKIFAFNQTEIHVSWDEQFGDYDVYYSKSTDGGQTWSAPVNLSNNVNHSYYSNLAVSNNGLIHLIYADTDPSNSSFFHITYRNSTDGVTWRNPVNISIPIDESVQEISSIAVNGSYVYVLFEDYSYTLGYPYNNIYYTYSSDYGATWNTRVNVSKYEANQVASPKLLVGNDGSLHAIFGLLDAGSNFVLSYSNSSDGVTWNDPINLTTAADYNVYYPEIVETNNGFITTFRNFSIGGIYFLNSTDGTTWNGPYSTGIVSSIEWSGLTFADNKIHLTYLNNAIPPFKEVMITYSSDLGTTWSTAENISQHYGVSSSPILSSFEGQLFSAWREYEGDYDIWFSTNSPTNSNNQVTTPTSTTATVNWTTDMNSNSSVKWGETTNSMPNSNATTTLTTTHSLQLNSLITSTQYYYNITSCNPSGLCTQSGPYSFTAAAQGSGEIIIVSAPGMSFLIVILMFIVAIGLFTRK